MQARLWIVQLAAAALLIALDVAGFTLYYAGNGSFLIVVPGLTTWAALPGLALSFLAAAACGLIPRPRAASRFELVATWIQVASAAAVLVVVALAIAEFNDPSTEPGIAATFAYAGEFLLVAVVGLINGIALVSRALAASVDDLPEPVPLPELASSSAPSARAGRRP
jgi:hypothetical protein